MKNLIVLVSWVTFWVPLFSGGATKTFVSPIEETIAIKCVAIGKVSDNVDGIYANPLQTTLVNWFQKDRRFEPKFLTEKVPTPDLLEQQPQTVRQLMEANDCNAYLGARVLRGANGLSLKVNLFSGRQGMLLVQETLTHPTAFETSEVESKLASLMEQLFEKLPYQGVILSRRGQLVTMNLGAQQKLRVGDPLTVVKIIDLERHPKLNFVVSTKSEVIGRIRVEKVEQHLSFGSLELERNETQIKSGDKIVFTSFKNLGVLPKTADGKIIESEQFSPVAFGEQPREWLPESKAQFGKASFLGGLSTVSLAQTLETSGGVSAKDGLSPTVSISGDFWLTDKWNLGASIKQIIAKIKNDLSGSSPSDLNYTLQEQKIWVKYNFLLEKNHFFGPKFHTSLGLQNMSSKVDDSSPRALTASDYGGLFLRFGGEFPFQTEFHQFLMGAHLNYFISPQMSEAPVTSGSSSQAQITQFSLYGGWQQTPKWSYRGELSFDLSSSSLSGAGSRAESASSMSLSTTSLLLGIDYSF